VSTELQVVFVLNLLFNMARQVQASKMVKRRRGYKVKSNTPRRALSTRQSRSVVKLSRGDYGFPDRMVTKLRYCDVVNLSGGGQTLRQNLFRMNSIFDVDFSGTGHQPMWHDQLAAIYTRYRVLGSKAKVTFCPQTVNADETTLAGPWHVGVTGKQTSSVLGQGSYNYLEDPDNDWAVLADRQGSPAVVTKYLTFSPKRDLGYGADEDVVSAAFGSNPSSMYYLDAWSIDVGNSTVSNMVVTVDIEFTVEVYQRLTNDGS